MLAHACAGKTNSKKGQSSDQHFFGPDAIGKPTGAGAG
jgi:hypothetical protein